jgi:hypothetical protein
VLYHDVLQTSPRSTRSPSDRDIVQSSAAVCRRSALYLRGGPFSPSGRLEARAPGLYIFLILAAPPGGQTRTRTHPDPPGNPSLMNACSSKRPNGGSGSVLAALLLRSVRQAK